MARLTVRDLGRKPFASCFRQDSGDDHTRDDLDVALDALDVRVQL